MTRLRVGSILTAVRNLRLSDSRGQIWRKGNSRGGGVKPIRRPNRRVYCGGKLGLKMPSSQRPLSAESRSPRRHRFCTNFGPWLEISRSLRFPTLELWTTRAGQSLGEPAPNPLAFAKGSDPSGVPPDGKLQTDADRHPSLSVLRLRQHSGTAATLAQ